MIKKALFLLIAIIATAVPAAMSQQLDGSWRFYTTVGENFDKVIETPGKTFFLTGNSLYSITDGDNEAYAYSYHNKLSDSSPISDIYYNPETTQLAVTYTNGNIDIIDKDGYCTNLPDIKDAIINTSHEIKDISFGKGRITAATEFGFVTFDDKNFRVAESAILNMPVSKTFYLADKFIIFADNQLYTSDVDARHTQLSNFTHMDVYMFAGEAEKLSDDTILFIHKDNKKAYTYTFDFAANTGSVKEFTAIVPTKLERTNGQGLFFATAKSHGFVAPDRSIATIKLPDGLSYTDAFSTTGNKSVWIDTPTGIARYDLSAATPSLISQPYKPAGNPVTKPGKITWSADGSSLYLYTYGMTHYHAGQIDFLSDLSEVARFRNGNVDNVLPAEVSAPNNSLFKSRQSSAKTKRMIGATRRVAPQPDKPDRAFVAHAVAGTFVIEDNKTVCLIDHMNSPAPAPGSWMINNLDAYFDSYGNFWYGIGYCDANQYYILTPDKVAKIDNVQKSDWLSVTIPGVNFQHDMQMVQSTRNPRYYLFNSGAWPSSLTVMDNNGTPTNFKDDKFATQSNIRDQDGNSINHTFIMDMVEDKEGKFWIATPQGIFIIDNISEFANTGTARRPIVPRNDGTNYGDYLLSTEFVYSISVDPSNRKWIGTQNSGAYLVSADGTEIIRHFNVDNSPLPSNSVYAVASDPHSNSVYFATANGVVAYDSDSSPAADDYSEVYAYPNPVRPEHTGWVTIAGLMDNSLVKIADIAGNVFFQGTSEGGMISWDCCDASGNRVKTGVYLVMASQNASGSSSGVVTKIMVIQ